MVGRSELICDVDGRWNGPPPRCEGERVTSFAFTCGINRSEERINLRLVCAPHVYSASPSVYRLELCPVPI